MKNWIVPLMVGLCLLVSGCSGRQTPLPSVTPETVATQAAPVPTQSAQEEPPTLGEGGGKLSFGFGLCSVTLPFVPEGIENRETMFAMERYISEEKNLFITANAMPLDTYEETALKYLNSYLSYAYALLHIPGEDGAYEETDFLETLADGKEAKGQIMESEGVYTVWFEVRSEAFGYNICITDAGENMTNEELLAVVHSFQYDAEYERDWIEKRQGKTADGTFTSADHGLQITFGPEWEDVPDEYMPQNSALGVQLHDGVMMVQILRYECVAAEDFEAHFQDVFAWYKEQKKNKMGDWEEVKRIQLPGLGISDVPMIEGVSNEYYPVHIRFFGFQYGGYTYICMFMNMQDLDEQAEPIMQAAMASLRPVEAK
jgi:hypothetical protein